MIQNFDDFVRDLLRVGFSMGGGNDEGILSLINWSWNEAPPYDTPVRWHTGDPETDPWEWRMRVLEERKDIAYAKLFFRKSGYITADWYPYFLAARRGNLPFDELYSAGVVSSDAKKIYTVLREQGPTPLHNLKSDSGMSQPDQKSRFDHALTDLQMGLMITMCARQQKISSSGDAYGWFSTVFCLAEQFFEPIVFEKAASLHKEAAMEAIAKQILTVNPEAKPKQIQKFILG